MGRRLDSVESLIWVAGKALTSAETRKASKSLTAAPIPPLRNEIEKELLFLNADYSNRSTYGDLSLNGVESSKEVLGTHVLPSGYRLVRAAKGDERFVIAMLHDGEGAVVYYVDCVIRRDIYLRTRPATQVTVWRSWEPQHEGAVHGIASMVFQDYLLGSYNVVVSDSCQTREGTAFWVKQLLKAMYLGRYVYRYDLESCKLTQITDGEVVRTGAADLWGEEGKYQKVLAIISKDHLPGDTATGGHA